MIVVDLDGPILEGRDRHYACYRALLDEAGVAALPLERYWAMKRARVDRRALLAESGALQLYDRFLAGWLAAIETPAMLALDRVQPGALDALGAWRAAGVDVVVVTARREREALRAQLDALALSPLLSAVVTAPFAETGEAKAAAFRAGGGDAAACAGWIGDTEVDVDAARRLGIRAVAVTCGLRADEHLRACRPDFLCRDLAEVQREDPLRIGARAGGSPPQPKVDS